MLLHQDESASLFFPLPFFKRTDEYVQGLFSGKMSLSYLQ